LRELLEKIKAKIQNQIPEVRDIDVFITPHTNLIPAGTQFPAIGIKDGSVKRNELMSNVLDRELSVSIITFVKMFPDEQSIMGGSGFKGVLELVEDLHKILDDDFLEINGVEAAFCEDENPSEMFGKPENGLQRKIIIYKYERRGDR
jgi:hypothetical protein